MKISIITPTFNNKGTVADTIESVSAQTHRDIEHIIIDGGSSDGTLEIIEKHEKRIAKIVSEPDEGLYDAINKGIKLASGDVIGILNSDDFYADNKVVETVAGEMQMTGADVCWGDLVYVRPENKNSVMRCWKSSEYSQRKFRRGWMPPHPAFFVRKEVYGKYDVYNIEFQIAADYELMLRFLEKHKVSSCYIPKILVKMRAGGKSNRNIFQIFKANRECLRAWKINGFRVNIFIVLLKPFSKIFQYRRL